MDGANLPPFIAGGAIYGHSALGEDINIPEMAGNTARVGTEAMIKSMHGAGITAYRSGRPLSGPQWHSK